MPFDENWSVDGPEPPINTKPPPLTAPSQEVNGGDAAFAPTSANPNWAFVSLDGEVEGTGEITGLGLAYVELPSPHHLSGLVFAMPYFQPRISYLDKVTPLNFKCLPPHHTAICNLTSFPQITTPTQLRLLAGLRGLKAFRGTCCKGLWRC